MSAFGGLCFWDGRPVPADRVSELAAHLTVAGPDRHAAVQPTPWLALQAHLLHFDRLSAAEQQPYAFAGGAYLTFDGRLDNRDDLTLCLHRSLGPEASDAALVAAAYEHWGLDMLPKLIGDWSIAIWDPHQQRIILARDYMGTRPLYYRAAQDRLVWATRLEALAACEDQFGAPDDMYIAAYLADMNNPDHATEFTALSKVAPGHVVIGTREGTTARRYWYFAPATLRHRSLDDHASHMRHLLTDAVRARLRSTKPVWAHLSGGWDSSTVVCLAHRLIERRLVEAPAIRPLSYVSTEPEGSDERRYMAAVEDWCGLTTTISLYRGRATSEELWGHRTITPAYSTFKMEEPVQAAGHDIVLTGSMGDMTTGEKGGALHALWEPFAEGRVIAGFRGLHGYAQAFKYSMARVVVEALRNRYRSRPPQSRRDRSEALKPAALRNGIPADLVARTLARPFSEIPSVRDFPLMHQQFVASLYKWALRDGSRNTEHFRPALWRTHPYSHRPFMEFLLAVPSLSLFDPHFPRAGMRRAFADILPPAILERRTKIGIDMTTYQRTERRQLEYLLSTPPLTDSPSEWCLVQRGIVDAKSMAAAIQAIQVDNPRPPYFLYDCITIETWLRSLARWSPMGTGGSPPRIHMTTSTREVDVAV